jgi:hypothetical protein
LHLQAAFVDVVDHQEPLRHLKHGSLKGTRGGKEGREGGSAVREGEGYGKGTGNGGSLERESLMYEVFFSKRARGHLDEVQYGLSGGRGSAVREGMRGVKKGSGAP